MLRALFLVLLAISATVNVDVETAPELTDGHVYLPGDLMIGVLLSIHGDEGGNWDLACKDDVRLENVENTQLLIEAIDALNANRSRLGGLRIGMMLYDFCARGRNALAQAIRFVPAKGERRDPYISLLCCETSSVSVLIAQLTAAYQIPQLASTATSDVLSDKTTFPYFMRTISPDRLQAQGMLDMIQSFNWTFVSVLYTEGPYGENLMKRVDEASKLLGTRLCVGYSKKVSHTLEEVDFDQIVDALLKLEHMRVVILFIGRDQIVRLFSTLAQRNIYDRFVWVASDAWWGNLLNTPESLRPVGVGALSFMPGYKQDPDLFQFLSDPSKAFDERNPWMDYYWEKRFNCVLNSTCNMTALLGRRNRAASIVGPYFYDALSVIYEGLLQYLPAINYSTGRFSNEQLLTAMKSVQFEGLGGHIQFDENGDLLGYYIIQHGIPVRQGYDVVDVGTWTAIGRRLDLDLPRIRWFGKTQVVPESVCSKPCEAGSIHIAREQVCCWSCFWCRENEITNANRSECIQCPSLTWPHAETLLECLPIVPTFVAYSDPTGVALLVVAAFGILTSLIAIGILVRHNQNRLIKACCREASFIMLTSITVHFACLVLLIGKPSYAICIAFRFTFHLTCCGIYAPIVIKISKIYRIFTEGKRSTRAPKFISITAQIGIIGLLIAFEILVVVFSIFIDGPGVTLFMPSPLQPVVESICNESVTSVCIGLAFNFILIVGCAFFAFKTRKLPDNFNESAQVAFSVCTAIIVWLVFIPSMSTTQLASRRVLMVALAIAINGFVVLIGIFFPKFYAVYFVEESSVLVTGSHPTKQSTYVDTVATLSTPSDATLAQ